MEAEKTTLNRAVAVELLNALSSKDLKAKHISSEAFMKLINLVTSLKKAINQLVAQEGEIAKALGVVYDHEGKFKVEEDVRVKFNEQMKLLQDGFTFEHALNFIPERELKEYVKEQDTSIAAVLFEYLLLAEA